WGSLPVFLAPARIRPGRLTERCRVIDADPIRYSSWKPGGCGGGLMMARVQPCLASMMVIVAPCSTRRSSSPVRLDSSVAVTFISVMGSLTCLLAASSDRPSWPAWWRAAPAGGAGSCAAAGGAAGRDKEYAPDQVPAGDQRKGEHDAGYGAVHTVIARAVERACLPTRGCAGCCRRRTSARRRSAW